MQCTAIKQRNTGSNKALAERPRCVKQARPGYRLCAFHLPHGNEANWLDSGFTSEQIASFKAEAR